MIEIYDFHYDNVIKSNVLQGKTTYDYAIKNIYPLINRFQGQRKIQDSKFYERLKRDILKKCLMPPITLAFITDETEFKDIDSAKDFVNSDIQNGYVLDGIQRLNTLKRALEESSDIFPTDQPLYLTIIVSSNKDFLLYRMITLNNGQKPMTPRHQIEVLTQELFDFSDNEIDIQTEKERSEQIIRGAFNLADISKAYLAFITKHVHNDNNKIISEKMDELLVNRILDANVTEDTIEFKSILELLDKFSTEVESKKWLKQQNNLIGFTVGLHKSMDSIAKMDTSQFKTCVEKFENAFQAIDISKVNLGKMRRELSLYYIENIESFYVLDELELIGKFSDKTTS